MIFRSPYFPFLIQDLKLFEEVKAFKSKYYRTSWSKVEDSSLSNIHIIPGEDRLNEISLDYSKMAEMIFEDRPSFDDITKGLKKLEIRLKNTN